jgi:sirohydrochlorin ferrochelatase
MNNARWIYETIVVKPSFWRAGLHTERLRQTLNDMGLKGWELVGMPPYLGPLAAVTLIFKKPA